MRRIRNLALFAIVAVGRRAGRATGALDVSDDKAGFIYRVTPPDSSTGG